MKSCDSRNFYRHVRGPDLSDHDESNKDVEEGHDNEAEAKNMNDGFIANSSYEQELTEKESTTLGDGLDGDNGLDGDDGAPVEKIHRRYLLHLEGVGGGVEGVHGALQQVPPHH